MENAKLADFIISLDKEAVIKEGKQFIEVTVPLSNLITLAKQLKENRETQFDFLACLTGIDYGVDLGVVYHLRSTSLNHTMVLKTRIPDRERPVVDSVAEIWKTAEYHEREVYDLLGIRFSNHPDLRRFFLENSAGYPLRKDYVDDVNIVIK